MKEKKYLIWYRLLYVFALLSSLSLLPLIWLGLVPEDHRSGVKLLCGVSFWGFLGLEMLCLIPCSAYGAHLRKANLSRKVYWRGNVSLGLISFAKNRAGLFADAAAIIVTTVTAVLYLLHVQTSSIVLPTIALTLLCWNFRSLLNGKNRYLYLKIIKSKENKQ